MTKRIPCLLGKRFLPGRGAVLSLLFFLPVPVSAETGARASAPPAEIVSIDWLQKDLSCDDLTNQMRDRYGKLGNFSELAEEKKVEIGLVLDIICGARFRKCNFKNCAKLAPATVAAAPAKPESEKPPVQAVDYHAEARKILEERVKKQEEAIQQSIAEIRTREAAEKRGWVKISVLTEEPQLEEPVEEETPAKTPPPPASKRDRRRSALEEGRARGSRRLFTAAASPAVPMMDVHPDLPSDGKGRKQQYVSKSDARFHQVVVATVRPNLSLPGSIPQSATQ